MKKVTVLFWQRKASPEKKTTLMCRITIDGKRQDIFTPIRVEPKKWDQKSQQVTGKSDEDYNHNREITSIKSKIFDIIADLRKQNKPITHEAIKYELEGGDHANTEFAILSKYREKLALKESQIGQKGAKPSTIKGIKNALAAMEYYITKVLKREDIFLHEIDGKFIQKFESWGRNTIIEVPSMQESKIKNKIWKKPKWSTSYIIENLNHLRNVTDEALELGIISKNPFVGFKLKREDPIYKFLDKAEMKDFSDSVFDNETTELVRDLFIFSSHTCLPYVDMNDLDQNDLIKNLKHNVWCISRERIKTGVAMRVPLDEVCVAIIEKYKNHPRCLKSGKLLPVPSLTTYNDHLKKIEVAIGSKKKIRSHVGRHTGATYMLNHKKMIPEYVAQIGGWKDTRILLDIYGKIHTDTLLDAFVGTDQQPPQKLDSNQG